MKHDFINPENGGLFTVTDFENMNYTPLFMDSALYKVFLNTSGETKLFVDGVLKVIQKNQLFFCKPLNCVEVVGKSDGLKAIAFNKAFYSIQDYEDEVSFYWFWFFGSKYPMLLSLSEMDVDTFENMFDCFEREFENKINRVQEEMLRYALKRVLVMSNSYVKDEGANCKLHNSQLEMIRKFNQLIEKNFKEKHQVSDYAAMLYKSPKTISNMFRKHTDSTPSDTIRDRIILEAKRLLLRTDQTIEEITYELGYETVGHFSKLFKNVVGMSPSIYRKAETEVLTS
ncbi:helix-turn-helix domain-containing protein [uncultured Croceitalea sp.]|uniref:helix-turn-helix domain-containing protein n=1 Tax=uncultured Croceitalea sp. TaxID=1798908 RepID=UPI00374F0B6C